MDQWTLRKKLLEFINAWPILLIVILLSSLIGWGAMHFWKPQPRANVSLYVGIDINRVLDISSIASYAETEPLNIDDYKNWQLSQFESLATSREVASLALERLQNQYQGWETVTVEEFQTRQDISWFDAGRWRLTVKAQTRTSASQAVRVWRDTLRDEFAALIEQAEKAYQTEGKLRALDAEITDLEVRNTELENLLDELNATSITLEDTLAGEAFDDLKRELLASVADYAGSSPGWSRLLASFPEEGDQEALQAWLDEVNLTAKTEQDHNLELLEELSAQYQQVTRQHEKYIKAARGFSPAFILEDREGKVWYTTPYPDGTVLLLSGAMGTLVYIIIWLMRQERREGGHD